MKRLTIALALMLCACSDSSNPVVEDTGVDQGFSFPDGAVDQSQPDQAQPDQSQADQQTDTTTPDQTACTPSGPEVCDGLDNDCVGGVDDGLDCLNWGGAGTDGVVTVSASFNLATDARPGGTEPLAPAHPITGINGNQLTGVAPTPGVAAVAGIAAGDEVLVINLRGSLSDSASVGNWETAFVDSVTNDTVNDTFAITLRSPLVKTYGVGGSNADLTDQTIAVVRIPQIDSLSVQTGGTLTTSAFNADGSGLGLIFLRAKDLNIEAGAKVEGSHLGYVGAGWASNSTQGHTGESLGGFMLTPQTNPLTLAMPNAGAGVGGRTACGTYNCQPQQTTGPGGGGASYATAGTKGADNGSDPTNYEGGAAGMLYGNAQLDRLYLGSGGGGGGGGFSGPGGGTPGGNGGALIALIANTMTVYGTVSADGQIGSVNSNCGSNGSGGGGAGSGGTVWLNAQTLTIAAGTVSATGGPAQCNGGGVGGDGRVRFDFSTINGETFGMANATTAANDAAAPDPGHLAQR